MAGIDKNRQNGSYNKFDGKRSERKAFGTLHGKFIIFHNNSLPEIFRKISYELFLQKFVKIIHLLFSPAFAPGAGSSTSDMARS